VTSVSKPLGEYYAQHHRKRIVYIPNGIGTEDAQLDEAAAGSLMDQHGVEPGNYVLFAAGRIIPTKGTELLLEAYHALDTDLRLLIVGDASQLPAYERRLHDLADSRVVFIPPVDKPVLLGLVQHAQLFVFPSTVEAMSMMLLEAASLGVPIVASDIAENVAVLPQQALYFQSGDADDLGLKMEWALRHPEQMLQLGAEAKDWVQEHHQWDAIVEQYEHLYQLIVDGGKTASMSLRDAGNGLLEPSQQ
jgi:glycosyltransferase involved in cell wall biosynthesis